MKRTFSHLFFYFFNFILFININICDFHLVVEKFKKECKNWINKFNGMKEDEKQMIIKRDLTDSINYYKDIDNANENNLFQKVRDGIDKIQDTDVKNLFHQVENLKKTLVYDLYKEVKSSRDKLYKISYEKLKQS